MSTITISQLPNSGALTGTEVIPIVQSDITVKTTVQDVADLAGGLEGTNYVYVAADGTDVENAAELQAAYNTAKTMSPSIDNRIVVICGPGKYKFPKENYFILDTEFIDVVSLTGNRDLIIYKTNANNNLASNSNNILVNVNNVFVKGIDASTNVWVDNGKGGALFGGVFNINNQSLNNIVIENCKGGNDSFGGGSSGGTASGTFNNCIGGGSSFGSGTASGTFNNCIGGVFSFGAGSNGTASGIFNNCISDGSSFGGNGTASGTFINCVGGSFSFGKVTASGTFNNCIGGVNSFGGNEGTLSGKLYYCRLTSGTFRTVSGSGITRLCLDGNNAENNQG